MPRLCTSNLTGVAPAHYRSNSTPFRFPSLLFPYPRQALIKPQYVDNISKAVKGNVELILKGKSQRNNLDAMVDALGTSSPLRRFATATCPRPFFPFLPLSSPPFLPLISSPCVSPILTLRRPARRARPRRRRPVRRRAAALCDRHELHPKGRHVCGPRFCSAVWLRAAASPRPAHLDGGLRVVDRSAATCSTSRRRTWT